MKRKIYTSMSVLHFAVGTKRIAFTPLSTKSSYFETTDEALQKKIEAHPWFGDKYRLKSEEEIAEKTADAEAAEGKEKTEQEKRKIHFSTLTDAKEWLAKEFGVPRSNIKKKDDAIAVGNSNGVEITIGVEAAKTDGAAEDNKE